MSTPKTKTVTLFAKRSSTYDDDVKIFDRDKDEAITTTQTSADGTVISKETKQVAPRCLTTVCATGWERATGVQVSVSRYLKLTITIEVPPAAAKATPKKK